MKILAAIAAIVWLILARFALGEPEFGTFIILANIWIAIVWLKD